MPVAAPGADVIANAPGVHRHPVCTQAGIKTHRKFGQTVGQFRQADGAPGVRTPRRHGHGLRLSLHDGIGDEFSGLEQCRWKDPVPVFAHAAIVTVPATI